MLLQNSNQHLGRQVYEYLRDQMKRGILKPGSPIKTGKIIEELGISKTPLRDALIQLQAEGFVTVLPQRGVVINSLTFQDAICIYEILGGLESRVMITVFCKIGEKEIGEFKRLNSEMLATISGGNFKEYNDRNIEFHDVFLNLSENEMLLRYARILKQRLYDFPTRDYGIGWKKTNAAEHQQFIKLIEESKPKEAAEFIRDVHWNFRFSEGL